MNIKEFDKKQHERNTKQLAIDFDGVIHKSSKSFYDGTIYDDPVDGVEEALKQLSRDYTLIIYTCKANPERPLINSKTGTELIWDWLRKYELDSYIDDIVYGKPNAKYYIDDKAICFIDWNQILKVVK
jgi:histidinol phosphatase-like enzyme